MTYGHSYQYWYLLNHWVQEDGFAEQVSIKETFANHHISVPWNALDQGTLPQRLCAEQIE